MAVITTGNHPKALWPGVFDFFGSEYNRYPKEYPKLFRIVPSEKNFEEVVKTHGFGLAPVKNEGTGVSYTDHSQLWVERGTHVAYAYGYIVTKEELDDNLYKSKSFDRAAMLADSFVQTVETVAAQVYNRADDSNYTGGDGVELLSTAHPDAVGGTWSNELATAADLSEASLEDLSVDIETAEDDVGLKLKLMPQCLLVHPNEGFNAERILKSTLQNDSANNAINALRSRSIIPEYAINHYFTDQDQWFVKMREGNVRSGMLMFTRKGFPTPEFEQDNDFDTKNAKASAYMRFVCIWGDPRDVYGSPGA